MSKSTSGRRGRARRRAGPSRPRTRAAPAPTGRARSRRPRTGARARASARARSSGSSAASRTRRSPSGLVDELAALRKKPARDVLGEPAGLEVPRVHPRAADELEEVEDRGRGALKQYQSSRDRTELERAGAEPDQVRVEPVQLAEAACASTSPSPASRARAASRPPRRRRSSLPGTRGSRSAGAYVIAFHHVFCSMFFSKPVCR